MNDATEPKNKLVLDLKRLRITFNDTSPATLRAADKSWKRFYVLILLVTLSIVVLMAAAWAFKLSLKVPASIGSAFVGGSFLKGIFGTARSG
ncbi:MAG: hypothetical protein EOP04_03390 [Proteobacteria bacterium]|nr:MAG: hypothetical protein EOP04_03390 [Pseudomonadota bacterium]